MTTTANTANTANSPERFPHYCVECGEGMRTGYQHEEDTSLTYCSLECAADGLEMTVEEMEEAYDNAVDGREARRPSREALVTYEEWIDSPHEDYEAMELVADGPSGRLMVDADDLETRQLLASVGITVAEGSR